MADPISTNDPVFGVASDDNATETRINGLDALTDENISLSMNFAVDFPAETFKASFLQLVNYIKENVINAQYLVGDVIIGTTTDTPAARGLTGTWQAIENQTALNAVSLADPTLGTITGNNDPAVPLLAHTHAKGTLAVGAHAHTMNHDHPAGTTSGAGGHSHTIPLYSRDNSGTVLSEAGGANLNKTANTNAVAAHTHTFNVAAYSGNTGNTIPSLSGSVASTGTANATLNVQGKVLNVIFWQKTAL